MRHEVKLLSLDAVNPLRNSRYQCRASLDSPAGVQAAALFNVRQPDTILVFRQVFFGFADGASADARLDDFAPDFVFGRETFFW